jgi:hypothetical protein
MLKQGQPIRSSVIQYNRLIVNIARVMWHACLASPPHTAACGGGMHG